MPSIEPASHVDLVTNAMVRTREIMLTNLFHDPEEMLKPIIVESTTASGKVIRKPMLTVDRDAERDCKNLLRDSSPEMYVLGEETLWDKDINLTNETRTVVLLDMVDGTDLLERGLGNWCSAAVVCSPSSRSILGAIVQDSENNLYVATDKRALFFRARTSLIPDPNTKQRSLRFLIDHNDATALKGPQNIRAATASICFYTQKLERFTSIPAAFGAWLTKIKFKGRLYTMAGNPMMAKLANGDKIHIVFEHRGQHAHDAVPGLYIALRGKAHAIDISSGRSITDVRLIEALLTPTKSELKYVLATSKSIAEQVTTSLNSSN